MPRSHLFYLIGAFASAVACCAQVNGGGGGLFAPASGSSSSSGGSPWVPAAVDAGLPYLAYQPGHHTPVGGGDTSWASTGTVTTPLVGDGGASAPAYVANAINGFDGVSCSSAVSSFLQSSSTIAFASTAMTIYVVHKITTTNGPQVLLESTANAQSDNGWFVGWGGCVSGLCTWNPSAAGILQNVANAGTGTFMVETIVLDQQATTGSNVAVWLGPHQLGGAGGGSSGVNFATDLVNLCTRVGGTYQASGTVVEFDAFLSAHTIATINSEQYTLISKYALPEWPSRVVCSDLHVGDSLSNAVACQHPWTARVVLDSDPLANTVMTNRGWSGRTLADINAKAAADAAYAPTIAGATDIYTMWAGTNDFAASTSLTAASMYSTWQSTLTTEYATRGTKYVIAATTLPRAGALSGGVTEASFDVVRLAFNSLLTANAGTCWGVSGPTHCSVADIGGDPVIGQIGQETSNTTCYANGSLHLNECGEEYVYDGSCSCGVGGHVGGYWRPALVADGCN
jgi:hypothetical protein